MDNVAGNWTGKISGTNNGNVFVEISQNGNSLSGTARINDLMFGSVVYVFTGELKDGTVYLKMAPDGKSIIQSQTANMLVNNRPVTIQVPGVQYGIVSVEGKMQKDGTISGKWTSTLGTGGTVYLWKENGQSAESPIENLNQAFVMMSISTEDPRLEDVLSSIKRATKDHGIECVRVDEIEHTGKITDLILDHLRISAYLICDISTERPNVYYELGYAHGIKKEVILIAQEGSNIHFDIKDYNIIFYKSFTDLESKLSKRIAVLKNK